MTTVGVIFGGPSPEHDVSILTGLQAVRALAGAGSSVEPLYWAKTGDWFAVDAGLEAEAFVDGTPKGGKPVRFVAGPGGGFVAKSGLGKEKAIAFEVAVNCCHGGPGEDGTLQGAFDLAGIAYTGPTVAGAALGMDKFAFGAVVAGAGMPSLPKAVLAPGVTPSFPGPYLVKPRFGGSSIGIQTVADVETAVALLNSSVHLRAGAIIEPYRADTVDLNVAIRTYPEVALSAVEQPVRSAHGGDILGYADKYVGGEGMVSAPRELPANISAEVEKSIRDMAMQVAALAGVRGVARLDFLFDGTDLYVNELNTIPGSLAKYLWVDPPVAFERLLLDMVAEAKAKPAVHYTAAGADGSALRSAGTIASKLG